MKPTQLHFLWNNNAAARPFRTGVSLHSHTMYSHEAVSFLPKNAYRVPVLAQAVRQQERNYLRKWGHEIDYSRIYWTPPHPPREALALERKQLEDRLGVKALVSLTDHDEIEACMQLDLLASVQPIPISTEWTVPFGPSFIHLGVHNLPPEHARSLVAEMTEYTIRPTTTKLRELLAALNGFRETLIVHNHPLWDEQGIGGAAHVEMLRTFLKNHGAQIHALELNGLRPWSENRSVCMVARETGHPVISGGDRHGCEPNANVNLTNAANFAEFVEEIRFDGRSEVLFMPQYREARGLRYLETLWDVLRDYPEHPNRVRWTDRVFLRQYDGTVAAASALWKTGEPDILRWFKDLIELFHQPGVRSMLRLALPPSREFAK